MQTAATPAIDRARFLLVAQLAPKEIGQRIQQARKEKGLTQDELSEMSTFSRRALQTWESGAVIPYRNLRELAGLLNRPTNWFLYGELGAVAEPEDQWDMLVHRLESLEESLANVATHDELRRGLDVLRAAIDAQASQGTESGSAEPATGTDPQ